MRGGGQVPSVSRTYIAVRSVTNKWPCDDTPDVVLVHELSRDFTEIVEPLQAKRLFMTRDLEHTVG
jgi:hypothetical protein